MTEHATVDPQPLEDAFAPQPCLAESARRDERRRSGRVVLERPIRYRFPTIPAASSWARGLVENVSTSGGAFLVEGAWDLVERIESEEWVPLDVELPVGDDGDEVLRVRAEVVWVQPDGGGDAGVDRVGVTFVVDDDDRAALAELIALIATN